jgi:ClpP class serine protease
MSHKLYRLLDSVYNTPHLVTQSALVPIVEYLRARNSAGFSLVPGAETAEMKKAVTLGKIGEIKVDGVLTYRPVEGDCGPSGVSYTSILDDAAELISAGCTTILMTHSSPGGEAAHCFTTADELRRMADEAGVRLISYVDEMSASASLALSVVADEVIIHPSAQTGSIGCVVALMDVSKAMADAGLKPIYISSTPGKTPFETDGSFSESFLAEVQDDVTRLGMQFAEHVSANTGIDVDTILGMDAKMFHAQAALEVGLVNKIMNHNQLAEYLGILPD